MFVQSLVIFTSARTYKGKLFRAHDNHHSLHRLPLSSVFKMLLYIKQRVCGFGS